MHGFRPVAGEHREVMHLARRTRLDHQAGRRAQAFANQVLVDRRQRQQRRNRDQFAGQAAVGDDQDIVAAADRIHSLRAQRRQLGLDAFAAPADRIDDVDLVRLELAERVLLDRAQARHVVEVEHRLRDLEAHLRVDGVDVEQVGLRADERVQRHHDRLADRVDRRVRHLGEQLLEVVVQRLVLVAEHGQRRVVAHRADGLLAEDGHRAQQELDVFLRVAERLLAIEQRGGIVFGAGRREHRDLVELDAHVVDPLPIRLGRRELVLQLLVVDDATLLEVDQEHLARLQAPLLDDPVLRDVEHARLRCHHHEVVVGDDVARRTQAVAVERGADLLAVGEHHRGRAVPRLHHGGVVLVEGAAAQVHHRVLLPGFRDHHHRGVRERVAGHREQLERVVERRGVGLALEADRVELAQVVGQHRRLHHALARAHPVEVALDGVDLAVVRHHPVRVGQRPFGEGVGREALVHQRERGDHAWIGQVLVVLAHLVGQQQALVDDGAAAHAGHVVLAAVRQLERLDGGRRRLADHVQLAFQRVGHDHVGTAADEDLAQNRLLGAHRRRHRHLAVDRHVAPPQQHLALGLHGALELLLAGEARRVLLRQEDLADAVFAGRRQVDAGGGHLGAEVFVGDLDQDARAVAHQLVGADGAAMVEVLEDLQALRDDRMRALALDVRHEADAAGIVLVRCVVQPARSGGSNVDHRGGLPLGCLAHGESFFSAGKGED